MRRICVRGIIEHEGRLLVVRHRGARYWATPGGGLDDGETLADGLRRELVEELGVEPMIGELLYIQQYRDEYKEFLELFWHIRNCADYARVDLSQTTHGDDEIEAIDFVDPGESDSLLPVFLRREFAVSRQLGFEHQVRVFDNLTVDHV